MYAMAQSLMRQSSIYVESWGGRRISALTKYSYSTRVSASSSALAPVTAAYKTTQQVTKGISLAPSSLWLFWRPLLLGSLFADESQFRAGQIIMTTRGVIVSAIVVRLALILFGAWQDANLPVHYTDVDYAVFTDAARYMATGESPYLRSTYRYTPLLAAVLMPNVYLSIWGKLLFSAADILVGWSALYEKNDKLPIKHRSAWGSICAAIWLFNPFTMTISTRGNGEALVIFMLVMQMKLLQSGSRIRAGILFGLSVHWRIYPAIYGISSLMNIAFLRRKQPSDDKLKGKLNQIFRFGAAAGISFICLGIISFMAFRDDFLEHAVLYHISRLDHRHNFSVFFYHIYLTWGQTTWLPKVALISQAVLNIAIAAAFHRDLPFCWLVQTITFVAFNKVCTAQYFVWYFGLLPFSLASIWSSSAEGLRELGSASAAWLVAQLNWLAWAYSLEFQGHANYLMLWGSSCVFLLANVWLIVVLMKLHHWNQSESALSVGNEALHY